MRALNLLSLVLHLLVGLSLVPALQAAAGPVAAAAMALWLLASAWLLPQSLRARGDPKTPRARALAWASLLAMGAFSSLFVLTLLRGVVGLALSLLAALGLQAATPLGAAWSADTAIAVPLVALALTAWGFVNARRTAQVREVTVPLDGLPEALHGLRIAQLSDIHVGPTIQVREIERIVQRVNTLDADLVAITGDLVDGPVHELARHVAPLSKLQSRHGTFFVTGNHEYYAGALDWIAAVRALGITVLLDEHVVLRHGTEPVVLAGVTDYTAHHHVAHHRSDPGRALAGAPASALKVLLAHQPRSAGAAAEAGFHLQLSGHTHGGQFLPWNWFVPLQQPFVAGLHAVQKMWVYVSRGTGYWGPPKRLGAPAEITRLTLVRA